MKIDEKSRRMAIRRDVGNRLPPTKAAPMGAAYLIAHACFTCRKSFKVASREQPAKCPNCAGQLHEMGRSFKAPPARDTEQWAKVHALYNAGFRFFSYRSYECAPLPARLSEVEAFVRDNPDHPLRVARPNHSFKPTPLRGAA